MTLDRNAKREPMTCEVVEHIGFIGSNNSNSISTELKVIKWNGNAAKYDLRSWRNWNGNQLPLKGITLTEDEMRTLYALLKERFEEV